MLVLQVGPTKVSIHQEAGPDGLFVRLVGCEVAEGRLDDDLLLRLVKPAKLTIEDSAARGREDVTSRPVVDAAPASKLLALGLDAEQVDIEREHDPSLPAGEAAGAPGALKRRAKP
jgi:hypothetical protein